VDTTTTAVTSAAATALRTAASLTVDDALQSQSTTSAGLTSSVAAERLVSTGPNAVRTHHLSAWSVLLAS
jgi:Mg2+-importing ATPase